MKCPLILAREMAPSTLGYSAHQNPDIGRIYDAVLISLYGEGYENATGHLKSNR